MGTKIKKPVVTPSPDSAPPPKRAGGAPRNNRNAEKSGRYGKHLSRLKLDHNARLDTFERDAVAEAKAILQELSLDDAAIGTALGRQYARLEVVASKLVAMLKSRGMRDRSGRLKAEVAQLIDVLKSLLTWLERLLRQAAEVRAVHGAGTLEEARAKVHAIAADFPQALEFRICNPDGSDFSFGFGDGSQRPMLADPLAAMPMPSPDPLALPEATQAPQSTLRRATLLDAHPSDLAAPKAEAVPVPPRTIDASATPTQAERWWAEGKGPHGEDLD